MKLKVKQRYSSHRGRYEAGEVIDVPSETAAWLMVDAPGCFEVWEDIPEPEAKALDEPPEDKMMRGPRKKK